MGALKYLILLRQGLAMKPGLSLNFEITPRLWSAGISNLCHHSWLSATAIIYYLERVIQLIQLQLDDAGLCRGLCSQLTRGREQKMLWNLSLYLTDCRPDRLSPTLTLSLIFELCPIPSLRE